MLLASGLADLTGAGNIHAASTIAWNSFTRVTLKLHAHLHPQSLMRHIPPHLKILPPPPINPTTPLPANLQRRKSPRRPLYLHLQRFPVVDVNMRIAHRVRERPWDERADVREHVGEEGVGGDVEGYAEAHVVGALVEEGVQDALGGSRVGGRVGGGLREADVELREHVTGREGHFRQIRRVPGGEDDPAIVGVVFEFVNHFRELIDALAGVICMTVFIRSAEVSPLKAIHRPQIPFLPPLQSHGIQITPRSIAVPDPHILVLQRLGIRVAADEPKEFGDDGAEEDTLGC